MPVRSLRSSVLKWPDVAAVDRAVRAWAEAMSRARPDIRRIGYFGSYARGDWGVGSDLDPIVIVDRSVLPFEKHPAAVDTFALPVPADVLVYTAEEWERGQGRTRFHDTVESETVWVFSTF